MNVYFPANKLTKDTSLERGGEGRKAESLVPGLSRRLESPCLGEVVRGQTPAAFREVTASKRDENPNERVMLKASGESAFGYLHNLKDSPYR